MRLSTILAGITAINGVVAWPQGTTGVDGDAPVTRDSPQGNYALAVFPQGGSKDIVAEISAAASPNGGLNFVLNWNGGLPRTGGPFMYHVHEDPVPENGNCTATKAHLDPYKRGEVPVCDPKQPQTCQTGDLSGKWGDCQSLPGCSLNFTDKYLSLSPNNPSYIGNRSIVIHYANKTRIACANFVINARADNTSTTGGSRTSTIGAGSTSTSTSRPASSAVPSAPSGNNAATWVMGSASASSSSVGFFALVAAVAFAML